MEAALDILRLAGISLLVLVFSIACVCLVAIAVSSLLDALDGSRR